MAARRERANGAVRAARLEVFDQLFASVAEEMGAALARSAFSPNIKERRDFSCALFDARGRLVAQAAHIPVHLGSIPACVAAVREASSCGPATRCCTTIRTRGGTHLPDVTLGEPIFLGRTAHARSSSPRTARTTPTSAARIPARWRRLDDVHGEGLRLPPIHLVRGGEPDREFSRCCSRTCAMPRERRRRPATRSGRRTARAVRRSRSSRASTDVATLAARGDDLSRGPRTWWRADRARCRGARSRFEDVLEAGPGADVALRVHAADRACRRRARRRLLALLAAQSTRRSTRPRGRRVGRGLRAAAPAAAGHADQRRLLARACGS
jgi:hypothetical protein